MPFRDDKTLREHFLDHGTELGIATEAEYLARAEAFLNGPLGANALECNRPQGGRARYDTVTEEYGSVSSRGYICTYMRPNPRIHGLPTNLDYYHLKCR